MSSVIETPTVVFLTTDLLLSRVIRRLTNSTVSHVAIGLSLQGIPVLLQADIGGVQITTREKFLEKHTIVSEWEFTSPGIEKVIAQGVKNIGERYDYLGLFGYLAVLIAKFFKRKIRNPLASRKAVVCSEFIASLDINGDFVPEWKGLDSEVTMPSDLLTICQISPSFKLKFASNTFS